MQTTEPLVFEYAYAKKITTRVFELLQPHCEVIHIAGSIRRECLYCKDIEIVCEPKKVFIPDDLFGDGKNIVCPGFIEAVELMKESIVKGTCHGRYMQVILKGGIKLDLFMPEPADYFRQLSIRIGSADFSHKILANRWTSLGWVGTHDGLRRKKDCFPRTDSDGKVISWVCKKADAERPEVWKSEKDFFEWLGIHYLEPKHR